MSNTDIILQSIAQNNACSNRQNTERVLVLYEDPEFFIGDTCIKFNLLGLCKAYYSNADVTINFTGAHTSMYEAILNGNPDFDSFLHQHMEEIDFLRYDVVICASSKESVLFALLQSKYKKEIAQQQFPVAFYSISRYILRPAAQPAFEFPVHEALFAYVQAHESSKTSRIHISNGEREWGNQWFRQKGVKEDEEVFILLDSSSAKNKLLTTMAYFDVLKNLLSRDKCKVLIFDEKSIGKESFYKEWLGPRLFEKMIFSKSLLFRQDLRLIASTYTRAVIGPCTGLIHCASAIYNNFIANGMPEWAVPLLITYTGKYFQKERNTAESWWGNAPLVNVLVLRNANGRKAMTLLSDMTKQERASAETLLPCEQYTSEMILDFIDQKLVQQVQAGRAG